MAAEPGRSRRGVRRNGERDQSRERLDIAEARVRGCHSGHCSASQRCAHSKTLSSPALPFQPTGSPVSRLNSSPEVTAPTRGERYRSASQQAGAKGVAAEPAIDTPSHDPRPRLAVRSSLLDTETSTCWVGLATGASGASHWDGVGTDSPREPTRPCDLARRSMECHSPEPCAQVRVLSGALRLPGVPTRVTGPGLGRWSHRSRAHRVGSLDRASLFMRELLS